MAAAEKLKNVSKLNQIVRECLEREWCRPSYKKEPETIEGTLSV